MALPGLDGSKLKLHNSLRTKIKTLLEAYTCISTESWVDNRCKESPVVSSIYCGTGTTLDLKSNAIGSFSDMHNHLSYNTMIITIIKF